MEVITELVAKLPDMEIDGVMSEEMEARVWELRMPDLPQEEQLADIISEGAVPEEIKRATELLEKLTEYKPLAKIEEAEEQNYNMIDNVLNNGFEKTKIKCQKTKSSLKDRLIEKQNQIDRKKKENVEKSKRDNREI